MTVDTTDNPTAAASTDGTRPAKGVDIRLNDGALAQLNSDEAASLHALMDDLTACGVGRIVDLPQIIVVGEQSSGKSSVLEAITRLRFPVASGVCTRFATEIVLRKAAKPHFHVKVRFCDKREESIDRQSFSDADLPEIIQEAKELMGLSESKCREFSKDVLHIEVEGPNMHPLTLVDLPGIFHTPTEKQSEVGMNKVNELVGGYMEQPNSIILVVVEANMPTARHKALAMSMKVDPKRDRTLGVITKPDDADTDQAMEHIRLAKNLDSTHKLTLGWHVLKNQRPEDKKDPNTRDAVEAAFLNDPPWNSILETDRGIDSLRFKLSDILYTHTRRRVPGVLGDIEEKLEQRQERLKQYGEGRTTVKEMRSFLLTLSSEFERLTRAAVDGYYADTFFGDLAFPENRLRAELRSFHRVFDHTMKTKGHLYTIESRDNDYASSEEDLVLTSNLTELLEQSPYNLETPPTKSRRKINRMLRKLAVENEGRELPGSCSSELALKLFQELSSPWEDITKLHVERVLFASRNFVAVLFKHLIGSENTYPALDGFVESQMVPFFEERQNDLERKVEELLEPYIKGYALPLDAEFGKIVQTWITERLARTLQSMPEHKAKSSEDSTEGARLLKKTMDRASKISQVSDGGTFATERVLDMAEAYYEMARRTFTDNIINLAIERCLVRRLPDILTPTKIGQMEDEELKQVAAEPKANQVRRLKLQQEIETLKKGLNKCKSWQPLYSAPALTAKASSNGLLSENKLGTANEDKGENQANHKAASKYSEKSDFASEVDSAGESESAGSPVVPAEPSGRSFGSTTSVVTSSDTNKTSAKDDSFSFGSEGYKGGMFGSGIPVTTTSTKPFSFSPQSSQFQGFGSSSTTGFGGGLFGGNK